VSATADGGGRARRRWVLDAGGGAPAAGPYPDPADLFCPVLVPRNQMDISRQETKLMFSFLCFPMAEHHVAQSSLTLLQNGRRKSLDTMGTQVIPNVFVPEFCSDKHRGTMYELTGFLNSCGKIFLIFFRGHFSKLSHFPQVWPIFFS